MEQARALAIGRGHELDEGAVLAVWVGLLVDLGVAGPPAALLHVLEGDDGPPVVPGREAVPRLGVRDDLGTGEGGGASGGDQEHRQ